MVLILRMPEPRIEDIVHDHTVPEHCMVVGAIVRQSRRQRQRPRVARRGIEVRSNRVSRPGQAVQSILIYACKSLDATSGTWATPRSSGGRT
jgi:hypothetical protein